MELLLKRILKIIIFAITYYGAARFILGRLNLRKKNLTFWDPEIVFLAGISAALVTMAISKLILPVL